MINNLYCSVNKEDQISAHDFDHHVSLWIGNISLEIDKGADGATIAGEIARAAAKARDLIMKEVNEEVTQ